MIKTVVGFSFTDYPVNHLQKMGFLLRRNDGTLKRGYREFICFLPDNAGLGLSFEIREILEEELYFSFVEKKDFSPFITENAASFIESSQLNSVSSIQEILDASMPDGDLKIFLEIKKKYPLWALRLKCDDFNIFRSLAESEKKVSWQGHEAILIQLGESCFDLLITPDDLDVIS